jgi:arginine deiminase
MSTKDFTTEEPILKTLREQLYTSTAIISELSPRYAEYLKKPASTEKDLVAKELFANEALLKDTIKLLRFTDVGEHYKLINELETLGYELYELENNLAKYSFINDVTNEAVYVYLSENSLIIQLGSDRTVYSYNGLFYSVPLGQIVEKLTQIRPLEELAKDEDTLGDAPTWWEKVRYYLVYPFFYTAKVVMG